MKSKIHINSIIYSVIIGLVIICGFAFITGAKFATALFPEMALLAGFIITGFIVGYSSKGVTIIEPGIGAVIVSVLTYFLIPLFGIETFKHIWVTDWILLYLNGFVLSFVGAWLGELLQHGDIPDEPDTNAIHWNWVIAGTITGITVSIFVVNLLTIMFGPNPAEFLVPYFLSLLIAGLVIGWKSPGVTIREAGISGFLTITLAFDIVRMTLITESEIGWEYIVFGGILGTVVSLLGAWIGEKIQARAESR